MSILLEKPKDMAERLFPPTEKRVPILWDWDAAEQAISEDRKVICAVIPGLQRLPIGTYRSGYEAAIRDVAALLGGAS